MTLSSIAAIRAVDWSSLEDAFGGADDTGELLLRYVATRDIAIVGDLIERSVHQGFRFATACPVLEILCMLASQSSTEFDVLGKSIVTLALGDPFSVLPYIYFDPRSVAPPRRILSSAIDELTATSCFNAGKKFAEHALKQRYARSRATRINAFYCSFWFYAEDPLYQDSLTSGLESIDSLEEQQFRVVSMSLIPSAKFEDAGYPESAKATARMLSLPNSADTKIDPSFVREAIVKRYSFPWFEGGIEIPFILASLRDPSGLADRIEIAAGVFKDDPFRLMGVLWALSSVFDSVDVDAGSARRMRVILRDLDLESFVFEGSEKLRLI